MRIHFALLCALLSPIASAAPFELRSDRMAPTLLPGQKDVVFTIYAPPSDLESLKALTEVMQREGLGNGFDPGPALAEAYRPAIEHIAGLGWATVFYPPRYGEFQIDGGRSRLEDSDEALLQIFDRAGVFTALQLGEWGYYFHDLSTNEPFWRTVYGDEFDSFKHLMKPVGLKGYAVAPTSRREAYGVVRDYFLRRNSAMRGYNLSVTGHSHYEAYAAEWGARVIGLEVGENIAFAQSKIAFARGASRQWARPWSVQVSAWMNGSCTTAGPLRMEDGKTARGLDAGHSLSFYRRMWLHAWFAGAAMVTPEGSSNSFFELGEPLWRLSAHGKAAAEVFAFMRGHARGVPFTPLAVVLDHYAGYNAFQAKPWGILPNTEGDQALYDLFNEQLYPGADHIHRAPDPINPEATFLRATPYGELCDVLLSTASAEVLAGYPAILIAGDHEFDAEFVAALGGALRAGTRVLLLPRHAAALGDRLAALQAAGTVEVLDVWTNPATTRTAAISADRLAALAAEQLPVVIEGDAVQYAINRAPDGWVVELVNNVGLIKFPTKPAVVDATAVATVRLKPKRVPSAVREWWTNTDLPPTDTITVLVPPGESRFVALRD